MRRKVATGLGARMRSMAFRVWIRTIGLRRSSKNNSASSQTAITKRYFMARYNCDVKTLPRCISKEKRHSSALSGLGEADADVGALFQVDGIDETDLAIVERENH